MIPNSNNVDIVKNHGEGCVMKLMTSLLKVSKDNLQARDLVAQWLRHFSLKPKGGGSNSVTGFS